jgi:hypothetical protein
VDSDLEKTKNPLPPWSPLTWIHNWLAQGGTATEADLIFVLAGDQGRKLYAVDLFHQGRAPRLLLSVGRFEIRRYAQLPLTDSVNLLQIAAPVPPPQRHFFVWVEARAVRVERIAVGRLGTFREIKALGERLLERPEIKSVLIVSSGFHLRRVRSCCRALLPRQTQVRFHGVPHEGTWWQSGRTRVLVLLEFAKIPCYEVVLALHQIARRIRRHR